TEPPPDQAGQSRTPGPGTAIGIAPAAPPCAGPAQRGWSCRVFRGPHLDFEEAPSLAQLLDAQDIPFARRQTSTGAVPVSVYHFPQGGVPVQIYDSPVAHLSRPPHGRRAPAS